MNDKRISPRNRRTWNRKQLEMWVAGQIILTYDEEYRNGPRQEVYNIRSTLRAKQAGSRPIGAVRLILLCF